MKKIFILLFSALAVCSCRTVQSSIATIDKSHATDDIIYDLAETYDVPEIGTVYDYKQKATVVSKDGECVIYKIKINNTWYDSNRTVFNKYRRGDVVNSNDFKKIKN